MNKKSTIFLGFFLLILLIVALYAPGKIYKLTRKELPKPGISDSVLSKNEDANILSDNNVSEYTMILDLFSRKAKNLPARPTVNRQNTVVVPQKSSIMEKAEKETEDSPLTPASAEVFLPLPEEPSATTTTTSAPTTSTTTVSPRQVVISTTTTTTTTPTTMSLYNTVPEIKDVPLTVIKAPWLRMVGKITDNDNVTRFYFKNEKNGRIVPVREDFMRENGVKLNGIDNNVFRIEMDGAIYETSGRQ